MAFPASALRRTWPLLLLQVGVASAIEFQDVAREAGVDFRHYASKTSQKHIVEAMGAGVAMLDFDGDGLLDLYFVNGSDLTAAPDAGVRAKARPEYWNRLYRNLGDWKFEDVTQEAGVAGRGYGMGTAAADFDADGDTDLFVSNLGEDILFRNEGDGTFRDLGRLAGIDGPGWSAGAAFLDYDQDGYLDLFVARYLDWTTESSKPCGPFLPQRRSYCHPREFRAVTHGLYRNLGDGRFDDVSEAAGLTAHPGKGLGVALNDQDADGWVDIFVANDSRPQQMFRNVRGRRFDEVAVRLGAAFDAEGRDYAGMGAVWSDYNGDLEPDLLVNALGRQGYWLYRNTAGRFEPASEASGIAALSELRSGWGMGLEDFDNDGWRDLLVVQGHVMDDIGDSDRALSHKEPMMLARNLFGRFFDVSSRGGAAIRAPVPGRGAAFGDLDGDGRIDVAVNVNDGAAVVLRNVSSAGNSLTVRLDGAPPNRDAIGAIVRVRTTAGRELAAFRGQAGSYLSTGSPALHFGLGFGERCSSILVRWPDGATQSVPEPGGRAVVIRQTRNDPN